MGEEGESSPSALVFVGPSGVGKGTLIQKLMEGKEEFGFSCSHTTRAPREGEKVRATAGRAQCIFNLLHTWVFVLFQCHDQGLIARRGLSCPPAIVHAWHCPLQGSVQLTSEGQANTVGPCHSECGNLLPGLPP